MAARTGATTITRIDPRPARAGRARPPSGRPERRPALSDDPTDRLLAALERSRGDAAQPPADPMDRMGRSRNASAAPGEDMRVNSHFGDRVERIARRAPEETRALAAIAGGMRGQIHGPQTPDLRPRCGRTQLRELRGGR